MGQTAALFSSHLMSAEQLWFDCLSPPLQHCSRQRRASALILSAGHWQTHPGAVQHLLCTSSLTVSLGNGADSAGNFIIRIIMAESYQLWQTPSKITHKREAVPALLLLYIWYWMKMGCFTPFSWMPTFHNRYCKHLYKLFSLLLTGNRTLRDAGQARDEYRAAWK